MNRKNTSVGGFLLMEMLVVLVMLGIGLLGILAESSAAVKSNRFADQAAAGTALAQAKIEELKTVRFADLASGSDASALGANGSAGGIFTRSWDVTSQTVNGAPTKQITVTVRWPEGTGAPFVSLSTMVADVPAYGPNFPTVVQRSWRRG